MQVPVVPFKKVTASAADLCRMADLSPEAVARLVPSASPQGFLSSLVSSGLDADAVRFMAFALPAREGVWWAILCARQALEGADDAARDCLAVAEAWVYQPDEANRRRCLAAAEAVDLAGAAAFAALGAFWSGGSLAPEGVPDVAPDPRLSPIAVGASVLLAAAAGPPRLAARRFEESLARAMDIAHGGNGALAGERRPPT